MQIIGTWIINYKLKGIAYSITIEIYRMNQRYFILILHYRTMPGPPVVVCQGDEVLVDVYNHLREDTTSIHFHGTQSIQIS